MAPSPRFTLNGAALCGLSLESCRLSLRAGGPDSLQWSQVGGGSGGLALHAAVILNYQTFESDGTLASTATLFSGRLVRRQAKGGDDPGWAYVAENGWGDLGRIIATQPWKSFNPDTGSLETVDVSRVVLCMGADGTYHHTGLAMGEIIDLAAAKGANIAKGTLSPALTVPPTELVDTTCEQALRSLLAYHPDMVAWIERTALHVRPPSALPAISIDPCARGLDVEVNPQTEAAPGGVVLVWERTHRADGVEKLERIVQTAGSTTGWPPPLRMTIPLAGVDTTTKTQLIETRTIPNPEDLDSTLAKNFYKGLIPAISQASNSDLAIRAQKIVFADPKLDKLESDGETVNPNSRPIDRDGDQPEDFPRMLVEGQVQSWFPSGVKQYDALLSAKIHYKGTDAAVRAYIGTGLEINEPITITNALPREYRLTDEITLAEQPISNLAASYYSAISAPREEGSVSGALDPVTIHLRPGRRISMTGLGAPSPVREIEIDCLGHTFEARFGAGDFLSPKSAAELARAVAKNRPSWRRPEERTKAETGSGTASVREGANSAPKYGKPDRAAPRAWDLSVTGENKAKIQIPGQVRKSADVDESSLVTIVGIDTEWTFSVGKWLCLKLTKTGAVSVVLETTWDGFPFPIVTEDDALGFKVWEHTFFPLWKAIDPPADMIPGRHIAISESVTLVRLAPDAALEIVQTHEETPSGHFVDCDTLAPGWGAA